jgi:hypothetical protein
MADKAGFNGLLDTMEQMRKAWGGMGQMPSGLQPTLDAKEIEKRISDLKAVEQWLNMNLGLLRTTIQTLEVQLTTIQAIQTMGSSLTPDAAASPAAWWAAMQQFNEAAPKSPPPRPASRKKPAA